ncbi:hypothetical protein AAKU55_002525 [Oxalobacteraceae bacterium GrIS 1.11]
MSDSERSILDEAWDDAIGGLDWVKSVLFGQFPIDRPKSAIVADMMLNFVPGVVIVTSARDAVAIVIRLAQHPEKREELMEWIMLSACMITLALPLAMAAGGAVGAGVGAIVGGIAGSELGAALRAVMLMLMKDAGMLGDMVKFLQKFMVGDLIRFLNSIKFAKYEKALQFAFDKTIKQLIDICQGLRLRLEHVKYFDDAKKAIATLVEWEKKFYDVQHAALRMLPKALAELDSRLLKVIAQVAPKETHMVVAGVRAEKPLAQAIEAQRVHDVIGQPLLHAGAAEAKAGAHAHVSGKPHDAPAGSAPHQPNGDKPQPKLKADKIEKVQEGPNTKRQETLDIDAHAKDLTEVKPLQKGIGAENDAKLAGASTAALESQLADSVATRAESLATKGGSGYLSRSQRGPVLTGVMDPHTGEIFYGLNQGKIPTDLHPLMQQRLDAYLEATGGVTPPRAGIPGSHSEISALDQAIKAREALTGIPVVDSDLSNFLLHNRALIGERSIIGIPPRCANCAAITNGVQVIGGD